MFIFVQSSFGTQILFNIYNIRLIIHDYTDKDILVFTPIDYSVLKEMDMNIVCIT